MQFMLDTKLSSFAWSLNSNDGQTGGLLLGWSTPAPKVKRLQRLPSTNILLAFHNSQSRNASSAAGSVAAVGSAGSAGWSAGSVGSVACGQPYGECTGSRCCEQVWGGKRITCYKRDASYAGCQ